MIKAIIFDCFGVLYPNATGNFFEDHKDLFKNDSTFIDTLNERIDLGEITRGEYFEELERVTGMPAADIQNEYDEELLPDTALLEYIQELKQTYKIGLLSNAGKEEIDTIYRDKIDHLFDSITVSYEAKYIKPDPKIFHLSAKRLDVDPTECLFIDDNEHNIQAACDLGFGVVYYPNFGEIPRELLSLTNL